MEKNTYSFFFIFFYSKLRKEEETPDEFNSSGNEIVWLDSDSTGSESNKDESLKVYRGMSVLALCDTVRHVWKKATIKKITGLDLV